MACGLPVVASDIKGHRELSTPNETGLLFESENQDQLTKQLLEIYRNSSFRSLCGKAARDKVRYFSLDRVMPVIMDIYHQHF